MAETNLTLPTGAVYGSRVETSGDISVGNITLSHSYRVCELGEILGSSDSVFVSMDSGTIEATRISSQIANTTGTLAIGVRQDDKISGTLETSPTLTTISGAVVDEKGLSFDAACIYFGGEKTFRIKYDLSTPPRLLFQSLSSSGEYVTKFSILKN